MRNYTVTDSRELRRLCIKHNWFTCGSIDQYDKLFYANENGCPIEEIATIIWICSNEKHCRRDILSCLIDERRNYLRTIRSEKEE